MSDKWVVTVEEDPETGDTILPFPPEMLEKCDWREGDVLDFQVGEDDTISIVNLTWLERQKEV